MGNRHTSPHTWQSIAILIDVVPTSCCLPLAIELPWPEDTGAVETDNQVLRVPDALECSTHAGNGTHVPQEIRVPNAITALASKHHSVTNDYAPQLHSMRRSHNVHRYDAGLCPLGPLVPGIGVGS
jgi:hypothetical protein